MAGNRIFLICLGTVIFFSLVIINSRILSVYESLSSYFAWIGLTILCCGASYFIGKCVRPTLVGDRNGLICEDLWTWYMPEGQLSKLAVFFSAYFGFVIGVQFLDILILAPSQWDSFTYIMPRVLFYLQNGNLNPYPTNDLAQIAHVTGWSQIQAFGLLITGRREFGFSIFSLALFSVGLLATMESGRILSGKALGGWISGFVYATSVNVINLSLTPQSDMPIAGFLACAVYGLIFWINKSRNFADEAFSGVYPVLVSGSLALAAVMKASAILALAALAPIFLVLAWHLIFSVGEKSLIKMIRMACFGVLLGAAIICSGGYYSNYTNFGHPLGSKGWRAEHEFSDSTIGEQLQNGAKNFLRYAVHFLTLDGFYAGPHGDQNSIVRKFQKEFISDNLEKTFKKIGVNLCDGIQRYPFTYYSPHRPISNSDQSYPGILQSFLAVYDPWRGRSFSNLVVFIAPAFAIFVHYKDAWRKVPFYLLVFLGATQGLSAIIFRDSGPLVSIYGDKSTIFKPGDRSSQLARFLLDDQEYIQFKNAIKNFEWLKSGDKLGIQLPGGFLIYPFISNFNRFDYIETDGDEKYQIYDSVISENEISCINNSVKIGNQMYLNRKFEFFPERPVDGFDSFFGLDHSIGLGPIEGPYSIQGKRFRLMTDPNAELQFQVLASSSKFVLELSSIRVPNKVEIFCETIKIGEIDLLNEGKLYNISCDINADRDTKISIQLKASNGFNDESQNRIIYGIVYKSLLMPNLK